MTTFSSRKRALTPALKRAILGAAILPLALGVAACKKADNSATSSTPSVAAPSTPPAGKQWNDVIVPTNEGGLVMGNPAAPIKLVEYGSLSCPHCAKLAQDGMETINTYVKSGKVSYEFRSFAIHPQDVPLTVLVRCAPTEATFGLIEQLFMNYDSVEKRSEEGFPKAQAAQNQPPAQRMITVADALGYTEFFSARGLSVDQQHKCLADTAAATKVAKESEAISSKGIEATPTVFVNGAKVEGTEWNEVNKALLAAGAA
ncbi:thioredoxin domain-containing protein [Novosphingobium rosa]|uniref:thioredoxin domain-containing protein n=1 Tax=Novosphingobium rosa TaxID=76978 RepID=UPI0014724BBF|nr:thioredoxin domain-containing protein [Novosphingobium rosa]